MFGYSVTKIKTNLKNHFGLLTGNKKVATKTQQSMIYFYEQLTQTYN